MKELFKKWDSISLIKRIVAGLIIGAVLGVALPQLTVLKILGSLFTGALKAVAPVLVFVLVMSSLASAKGEGAGNMKTVIFLYVFSTLVAAVAAVVATAIFLAVAAVQKVPAVLPVPSGRRGFPGSFPCRPPLSSPRFPSTGRHSRVLSPV